MKLLAFIALVGAASALRIEGVCGTIGRCGENGLPADLENPASAAGLPNATDVTGKAKVDGSGKATGTKPAGAAVVSQAAADVNTATAKVETDKAEIAAKGGATTPSIVDTATANDKSNGKGGVKADDGHGGKGPPGGDPDAKADDGHGGKGPPGGGAKKDDGHGGKGPPGGGDPRGMHGGKGPPTQSGGGKPEMSPGEAAAIKKGLEMELAAKELHK